MMVIQNYWISIDRNNINWLLIFKTSARRGLMALAFNMKTILSLRKENSFITLQYTTCFVII